MKLSTAPLLWDLLLVWSSLLPPATAALSRADSMQKVKEAILLGYDKDVPPQQNATAPVMVDCAFTLSSVLDFDELAMEFSVFGQLVLMWHDPRLTWHRVNETSDLASIILPIDSVWTPPLLLVNPAEKVTTLSKDYMTVRYWDDGMALWTPGDLLKTLCTVDVTYFPFDKQQCNILFYPQNQMPSELKLVSRSNNEIFTDESADKNGKWEVIGAHTSVDENYLFSVYRITIHLKRRPIFFVVNVFLPVLFMSILNTIVFALPAESGERMSYCITVLLAIAVFLTILGDNIPKTSSPMSLLSFFLLGQLSVSVFICFAVVLNLRLFHKSERHRIPSALKTIVRVLNCEKIEHKLQNKITNRNNSGKTYDQDVDQQGDILQVQGTSTSYLPNNKYRTPSIILPLTPQSGARLSANDDIQSHRCHQIQNGRHSRHDGHYDETGAIDDIEEESDTEDRPVSWQDVSRAVDIVLAVFCVIVITASVIGFFLGVGNQGDD